MKNTTLTEPASTTPSTTRRAQRRSNRDAIKKVAWERFTTDGLKATSIGDIAQDARVSRVTFYKHFADKTSLIVELIDELMERHEAQFHELLESEIDFGKKLQAIKEIENEAADEWGPILARDLWTSTEPKILSLIERRERKSHADMKLFFQQGRNAGKISVDLPDDFILFFLRVMTQHSEDSDLRKIFPDVHERYAAIFDVCFYGISPQPKASTNSPEVHER